MVAAMKVDTADILKAGSKMFDKGVWWGGGGDGELFFR